jgi:hypothetical protein
MTSRTFPSRASSALWLLFTTALAGVLVFWITGARSLTPLVYFGGPLIRIASPPSGAQFPLSGVQLQVQFPDRERIRHDTFRCLLNGADVTWRLRVAPGGAEGSLFPLGEGRNVVRVEVFGKALWADRWVEDALEVEFVVGPFAPIDQASLVPAAQPAPLLAPPASRHGRAPRPA